MNHYLAINAVSWAVDTDRYKAISKLDPTNGFSDKILAHTLCKIYEPITATYDFNHWLPVGVKFSILEDQVQMLKDKDGNSPDANLVLLKDQNNKIDIVGYIDELGRLIEREVASV